jgi:hypothetical protein
MSIKEIESAIARLSPEDLAQLFAWLDQHYADAWDRQIEQDARAGRLDALVDEARRDFDAGRCVTL